MLDTSTNSGGSCPFIKGADGKIDFAALQAISAEIKAKEISDLPFRVNGPFDPYQTTGSEFLYRMGRSILADEVGLGKTNMTLSMFQYMAEQLEGSRFLVICGTSNILDWAQAVSDFTDNLQVVLFRGAKPVRLVRYQQMQAMGHHATVGIVSYDIAKNDIVKLFGINWDAVVIDESSVAKNSATSRHKTMRVISRAVDRLVLLNATPLENDVMDLYSQVELLYPGYLGSEAEFRDRYVITEEIPLRVNAGYYKKIRRIAGYKRLSELRQRVDWLMLRRKPDDVGIKYPSIKPFKIYLQMLPEQRRRYLEIKDGILRSANQVKKVKLLAQFKFLFLCVDGALSGHLGETVKVQASLDLVETLHSAGRKVVLFAPFKRSVNALQAVFERKGINVLRITGDEDANQRKRAMDLFNDKEDLEHSLILMTTAGARGINLPAAHDIILFSATYNQQQMHQIIGRLCRRTQTADVVYVYHLLCKRSIERSLLRVLARKQDLFDRVIEGKLSRPGRSNMNLDNLLSALRTDQEE